MSLYSKTNHIAFYIGDFLKDYLLLAMRLFWGWRFLISGWEKFGNIPLVTEFFSSIQIPFAWYQAYLVATVETVGGLCLLLGLASRVVAIPLAIIMIVALFSAHLTETLAAFENPQRFIQQLPINFLLTSLIVLSFGPGKFSLDALVNKQPSSKG